MAFATTADVEARLFRPLTQAEKDGATYILDATSGLIVDVAGATEESFAPAPFYFKVLCVEKAVAAISNKRNVAAQSETLGAYQHSETFPRELDAAAFLTEDEELKVRRIAGSASGSTRIPSLVHDTITTTEPPPS